MPDACNNKVTASLSRVLPTSAYNPSRPHPPPKHARDMPARPVDTRRICRPGTSSLAAVIAATALLAACGSTAAGAPASTGGDPAVDYAQCLRSHGLPNFPDPSPDQPPRIPSGIDTQAPAFRAAQRACAKRLPGGSGAGSQAESRNAQLLKLARCMRHNGVPTFPDPTSSPPPPSQGNAIGGPGGWFSLGTSQERQSPAYKHAAAVCGSPTP
jgi:hypothetical protein